MSAGLCLLNGSLKSLKLCLGDLDFFRRLGSGWSPTLELENESWPVNIAWITALPASGRIIAQSSIHVSNFRCATMPNVNIVNCQQCQMSTMSNVNNAKYQQCQISPDLSRFDQINQYLMRSVCRSDNVKMSIQSSKCQSNCQNVNPIVKMSIKLSNCHNIKYLVLSECVD